MDEWFIEYSSYICSDFAGAVKSSNIITLLI